MKPQLRPTAGKRILVALAAASLVIAGSCTTKQSGETAERPAAMVALDASNAKVKYEANGEERDGWSWLESADNRARWAYEKLPTGLVDLSLEAAVLVSSAAVTDGTATFGVSYGTDDRELGHQDVVMPTRATRIGSDVLGASGTIVVPSAELGGDTTSLWIETTTIDGMTIGVQKGSMHLESVGLAAPASNRSSGTSGSGSAAAPRPTTTKPRPGTSATTQPTTPTFSSTGDSIEGWWWLRDEAHQALARWEFAGVPTSKAGLSVDLEVLATDRSTPDGRGVDAHFYLTYGFTDASGQAVGRTTTKEVTAPNVSSADDPVGYTCETTLTIGQTDIPKSTSRIWFEARRSDPTGMHDPVDVQVAFRGASITLGAAPSVTTTTTAATTTTTASTTTTEATTTTEESTTTTTTIGQAGEGGGGVTGGTTDTDLSDDASSMDDADAIGELVPGTYDGNLTGDDVDDWFAFHLNDNQLVDVTIAPASGLSVSAGIYSTTRIERGWFAGTSDPITFAQAAGPGDAGRWYLLVHRYDGAGSYRLTLHVRNANDAMRGVDAGNSAADPLQIGPGTYSGDLVVSDPADEYRIDVPAGQRLDVSLLGPPDQMTYISLYVHGSDGPSVDDGESDGVDAAQLSIAPASTARTIRAEITHQSSDRGGAYVLTAGRSDFGTCSGSPVAAVSFSSSGARTGRDGATDPPGYWLLPEAEHPDLQSATWVFDRRPTSGDARLILRVPVVGPASGGMPTSASVYATVGTIPGGDAGGAAQAVVVPLRVTIPQTGPAGTGEITVPAGVLADASKGWWVRVSLADPGGDRPTVTGAGLVASASALSLCPAGATQALAGGATGTTEPPAANVTYGAGPTLTSDVSIFVDPASDPDGDGLNQSWEDRAVQLADPVLELDEQELGLYWLTDHPPVNFAEVIPWPSYANPRYVIIGYLSSWAYDPGGGVQMPLAVVDENHRGDSERIFEAWRIVSPEQVELEWITTSAHGGINDHSGVWRVNERVCTTAKSAMVTVDSSGKHVLDGQTEPMCAEPQFDDEGRLVMYASQDKHAMYPTKDLCEQVAIARDVDGVRIYGEDCGWDAGDTILDDGWWDWDSDEIDNDPHRVGEGRFRFDAYNVGNPGYPLIDNLNQAFTWTRLTDEQKQALSGVFMGESVWSATSFCGGLTAGGKLPVPVGADLTMPDKCSNPSLGAKFSTIPGAFVDAMSSRYRVTIHTGNVDKAGTDERILVELLGSDEQPVASASYEGDLERGATDVLYLPRVPTAPGGMAVSAIRVSRLTGSNDPTPGWYLASVEVEDRSTGDTQTFTAGQWIDSGRYAGWHS